jgi:hypothetical protein
MMVTIGGGNVEVGGMGAEVQDARVAHSRETIKVVRGIRELYLNKLRRTKGTQINADLC